MWSCSSLTYVTSLISHCGLNTCHCHLNVPDTNTAALWVNNCPYTKVVRDFISLFMFYTNWLQAMVFYMLVRTNFVSRPTMNVWWGTVTCVFPSVGETFIVVGLCYTELSLCSSLCCHLLGQNGNSVVPLKRLSCNFHCVLLHHLEFGCFLSFC